MGQLQGPPWGSEGAYDTTLPSRGFQATQERGWTSSLPEELLETGGENTDIY